jgi:plastocyanin
MPEAASTPSPASAPTVVAPPTRAAPPPTEAPPAGGGQAITIRAVDTQFVPASATLPAGAAVALTFDNQDAGVAHDIEIFDPSGAEIARSGIASGPDTQTLTFMLGEPGRYSFKCAVHPTRMFGAFAVQ